MARYRVLALALLVTVLLAVVAVAAHGRPLRGGGGRGAGPPAAFYDYAWTTVVIVILLAFAAFIAGLWFFRHDRGHKPRPYWLTLRTLAAYCVFALLFGLWARHHLHFRHPPGSGEDTPPVAPSGSRGQSGSSGGAPAQGHDVFQWPELFAVLAALLAVGAVLYLRRARGLLPARRRDAPESLASALDESLDDLRSEPDLRKAIVAAYARMETALAFAGIPRLPAEAPLEYLERALLSLDTSAAAVRTLTDLFEWAKFSHHEPEPSMRDEAIDALVAVRDELLGPVAEPVPG